MRREYQPPGLYHHKVIVVEDGETIRCSVLRMHSRDNSTITLKRGSSAADEEALVAAVNAHEASHQAVTNGLVFDGRRGATQYVKSVISTNDALPVILQDAHHNDEMENDMRRHPKDRGILGRVAHALNRK